MVLGLEMAWNKMMV